MFTRILSLFLVWSAMSCQTRENNELATPLASPGHLTWNNGTGPEPTIEVHVVEKDKLVIFRQSLRTTFEGPFIYLLLGPQKALLIDTGAPGGATSTLVDAVFKHVQQRKLFFTNSHSHNDHIAGNNAFVNRGAQKRDFGRVGGTFPLGDRDLTILAIPGHTGDHIAVWDPATKGLFTGDTIYPGNLYTNGNWETYKASIKKLADFVKTHEVDTVWGAHIEIQKDDKTIYTGRPRQHPNERHLEMKKEDVLAIHEAIKDQPPSDKKIKGPGWVLRTSFP